jgi:hypothetical protein
MKKKILGRILNKSEVYTGEEVIKLLEEQGLLED